MPRHCSSIICNVQLPRLFILIMCIACEKYNLWLGPENNLKNYGKNVEQTVKIVYTEF